MYLWYYSQPAYTPAWASQSVSRVALHVLPPLFDRSGLKIDSDHVLSLVL